MRTKMSNQKPDTFESSTGDTTTLDDILKLEQFVGFGLGATLGLGSYSVVRSAIEQSSGRAFAIKFAVDNSSTARAKAQTGCFWSMPLCQMTGSYGEVQLNAREFLLKQYENWSGTKCKSFPTVHKVFSKHGIAAAVMDLIKGPTLRELIKHGKANLDHVDALVSSMQAIEALEGELRHGDLKPENIVIGAEDSAAYVLDPGYYGDLTIGKNNPLAVKVTTPAYYPFLEPNDMFAVGVLLLEVLTGKNPLAFEENGNASGQTDNCGAELRRSIERARLSSNYYPSRIYRLPEFLDVHQANLTPGLKTIALKCMGLVMDKNGSLDTDEPYESFTQLKNASEKARQ